MRVVLSGARGIPSPALALALRVVAALGIVVALAGVPVGGRHALADIAWCWDDPVVNIDGTLVSTQIGVLGDPSAVENGVQDAVVVYTLPHGVHASVVSTSAPYFHERVVFRYTEESREMSDDGPRDGRPISISVSVRFKSHDILAAEIVNSIGDRVLSTSAGTTETGLNATIELE